MTAVTTNTVSRKPSFPQRVRGFIAYHRTFRITHRELSSLTPREMVDIGIGPFAIDEICHSSGSEARDRILCEK